MKILIAVDMEGISGVTCWDHVNIEHAEYQRFRGLMTGDVNAAIAGAAEAGATEILVTDGHWNGNNILIDQLDGRAHLNAGSPSPLSMVQGVETGVQAAMLIGAHARMGTPNAILDHTWSSSRVNNVWLNDRLVGEIGLNGAVCGHYHVPVVLVSGDQGACAEAREWLEGVETAQVKHAHSRSSAELLPISEAHAVIRESAVRGLKRFMNGNGSVPLRVSLPVHVKIEFLYSDMADQAALLPCSTRLPGRMIEFMASDMREAYITFQAAVNLARR
jgi:D-amino peptidase